MSRRRVHTKAGVAAAGVAIVAIAVFAHRNLSLPVLAGAFREALLAEDLIWKLLALGAAAGAALDVFALRRHAQGLHTFMHELAHATLALLFVRRVTRFVSTSSEGGLAQHRERGEGGRAGGSAEGSRARAHEVGVQADSDRAHTKASRG